MDGRFVPNLTFGAKVIESVRKLTKLSIDVHLMVIEPENYFDSFADAGANGMSIHTEVSPHCSVSSIAFASWDAEPAQW